MKDAEYYEYYDECKREEAVAELAVEKMSELRKSVVRSNAKPTAAEKEIVDTLISRYNETGYTDINCEVEVGDIIVVVNACWQESVYVDEECNYTSIDVYGMNVVFEDVYTYDENNNEVKCEVDADPMVIEDELISYIER